MLAPLFLVYPKNSARTGCLEDLKLLIDWCKKTGNSILQLLPMNAVGSHRCPYDALSSFALEPSYLHQAGRKRVYSKEFKHFVEDNSYWISDFALYKVIKRSQRNRPWYEWPKPYKGRDAAALKDFQRTHADEIRFQMWLQWQLHEQFKEAKRYAKSRGVFLKGDLPVLVSRDSADVWAHREFFKLEFAAGAPPDAYCAKGQRWGMPTYNWEVIARDGYRYLKEKLKYAENFYDMLRIDHVVGLFRIWSIPYNEPLENKGLNGLFDPRDENQWEDHGRRILSVIVENTKMLICAEDLGIIPGCCPKVLEELGIPGNDVQRWVKDWNVRHDFLEPKEYRRLSVAMLSTHDTTNWPAWWKYEAGTVDEDLFKRMCASRGIDFASVSNRLFNPKLSKHGRLRWLDTIGSADILASILGRNKQDILDFAALYENTFYEKEKLWKKLKMAGPMQEDANRDLIEKALRITSDSNSIFAINTIIDLLFLTGAFKGAPYKYRINTPGTKNAKNWSFKLPISLEELLKDKICSRIKWVSSRSS